MPKRKSFFLESLFSVILIHVPISIFWDKWFTWHQCRTWLKAWIASDNGIKFWIKIGFQGEKKPSQVVPSQTPDPQVFLQPEQLQDVNPNALLCSDLHKKTYLLWKILFTPHLGLYCIDHLDLYGNHQYHLEYNVNHQYHFEQFQSPPAPRAQAAQPPLSRTWPRIWTSFTSYK